MKTAIIVTAATASGIMLIIAYTEPFSPAESITSCVTIAAITPIIAEIIPDISKAADIRHFHLGLNVRTLMFISVNVLYVLNGCGCWESVKGELRR